MHVCESLHVGQNSKVAFSSTNFVLVRLLLTQTMLKALTDGVLFLFLNMEVNRAQQLMYVDAVLTRFRRDHKILNNILIE